MNDNNINEKLEVELAAWLEYESFAVRAKAVNGKILWWLWLTDKVMVRMTRDG